MNKTLTNKKIVIVLLLLIVLIGISYKVLIAGKKSNGQSFKKEINQEEIIPTIDSSVSVNLTKEKSGNELTLAIQNFPGDTDKIDYELSYETAAQGFQGIKGTIDTASVGSRKYDKKILLGTCSSGKCVYHKVVGKISLSLKFNGKYGEKVFEKEYEL